MALINTTTTGILGSTFSADGTGPLNVQQNGVTLGIYGNIPAFSAYLSGTQTISTATWTKYAASVERFDTAGCYDTTNYRFTPTVAGYYMVFVANWYSSATGAMPTAIYRNGTEYTRHYTYQSSGNTTSCQTLIYLNGISDYVEAYFYQGTGSNQTLDSSNLNPGFYGFLVKAV